MGLPDDDEVATKGLVRSELRKAELSLLQEMARQANVIGERMERLEEQMERLQEQMASQANIIIEQIGSKIAVVDEKYQDLPARVTGLERAAFKPKPSRRKR